MVRGTVEKTLNALLAPDLLPGIPSI
jgi:hypothetical protein